MSILLFILVCVILILFNLASRPRKMSTSRIWEESSSRSISIIQDRSASSIIEDTVGSISFHHGALHNRSLDRSKQSRHPCPRYHSLSGNNDQCLYFFKRYFSRRISSTLEMKITSLRIHSLRNESAFSSIVNFLALRIMSLSAFLFNIERRVYSIKLTC